jgi:hypothetical protein
MEASVPVGLVFPEQTVERGGGSCVDWISVVKLTKCRVLLILLVSGCECDGLCRESCGLTVPFVAAMIGDSKSLKGGMIG